MLQVFHTILFPLSQMKISPQRTASNASPQALSLETRAIKAFYKEIKYLKSIYKKIPKYLMMKWKKILNKSTKSNLNRMKMYHKSQVMT